MIAYGYNRIVPGMGKTEWLTGWMADQMQHDGYARPQHLGIHYSIRREEIEAGDLSRMIDNFGPRVAVKRLRRIRGKVHFTVAGYENAKEEIFEIPEIRRYFAQAHRLWPHWIYTASVNTPCLMAVALSLCRDLTVARTDGAIAVKVEPGGLVDFFSSSFSVVALMLHAAQVSEATGMRQIDAVGKYLGIPEF